MFQRVFQYLLDFKGSKELLEGFSERFHWKYIFFLFFSLGCLCHVEELSWPWTESRSFPCEQRIKKLDLLWRPTLHSAILTLWDGPIVWMLHHFHTRRRRNDGQWFWKSKTSHTEKAPCTETGRTRFWTWKSSVIPGVTNRWKSMIGNQSISIDNC